MSTAGPSPAPHESPEASPASFGDVPDSVLDPRTVIRHEENDPAAGPRSGSHVLDSLAKFPGEEERRSDPGSLSARLFPAEGASPGPVAGITIGHFEIEKRIGRGGMGAVFRALDTRLQRPVALKVLSPRLSRDPSSVQRFLNEARSAAQIDDERVARVFHCGDDGGLHYIAFEYIEGLDIRQRIRRDGRLRIGEALGLATQLAMALRATSEADVVHRDIKPSNVIVTASGRVKLVDLGLARKPPSESVGELTVPGTTLGTFDYISPEQAKDPRDVDVRSDLYSLGCTLYHMLTGEPPYPGGTLLQKLLDHQNKDVPDPRRLNPKVPQAVATLCLRLMAPDPAQRPQSAEEALNELTAAARAAGVRRVGVTYGGPGRVEPPRRSPGGWRWAAGAGLAAAVVTVLFVADSIERRRGLTATAEDFADVTTIATPAESEAPASDARPAARDATRRPSEVPDEVVAAAATPGSEDVITSPRTDAVLSPDPADEPLLAAPVVTPADRAGDRKASATIDPDEPELLPPPDAAIVAERATPYHIVVPGGGRTASFPTLEAACRAADDGDIIELAFDGPSAVEPAGIRLARKTVTVRAAVAADGTARRPVISVAFDPSEPADGGDAAFVLADGGLNLFGVAIDVRGGRRDGAVLAITGGSRVRLDGVAVTLRDGVALARVEEDLTTATLAAPAFGPAEPGPVFTLEIDRSIVRGDGSVLAGELRSSGRFEADDSLFGVSGPAFAVGGGDAFDAPPKLEVTSTHATWLVPNGLIATTSGPFPAVVPVVAVTARDSVFSRRGGEEGLDSLDDGSAPLVSVAGDDDLGGLDDAFAWGGQGNRYDGFATLLTLTRTAGGTLETRQFGLAEWVDRRGGDTAGRGDVAPADEPLPWRNDPSGEPLETLTADDVAFEPEQTAALLGTDGLPVGADLGSLPAVDQFDDVATEIGLVPVPTEARRPEGGRPRSFSPPVVRR